MLNLGGWVLQHQMRLTRWGSYLPHAWQPDGHWKAYSILPAHLLLDYLFLPEVTIPQTALIKGDCRSLSIAAASVLAKTSRDALMRELDLTYPGYGFAAHKGYGTQAHREALQRLGPSPVHRLSFALLGESSV